MKKRIDYKSKKFVITAALILIVSIAAIAGTVSFIRSNNDSEAVSDGEIENVVQNDNDAVNDLDDSTSNVVGDEDGDGIVDSTSATSDRNNFSSLQTTTITEYKDVEKVTSKSKMIGWAPNALNINIDNFYQVFILNFLIQKLNLITQIKEKIRKSKYRYKKTFVLPRNKD